MVSVRQFLVSLCCPLFLAAQTPAPAPQAGLQPDWDVGVLLNEMSAHATRLLPMLNRINVKAWLPKGAPASYEAQLQSAKDQARSLAEDAKELAGNPEKVSACLKVYFRVQALEQMIVSLVDATRKYQDPATAGALASLSAENGTNRDRFQTYIVNLTEQREQECAVMDHEAQRCRGVVATQAPRPAGPGRKK